MLPIFTSILIISVTYLQVSANDSEQVKLYRSNINDQYPISIKYIRKLCLQKMCSEIMPIDSHCVTSNCMKRALQDGVGPFWANRGKKDPTYRQEHFYAEEPHWVLVRRAQDRFTPVMYDYNPFFVTRGKKNHPEIEESNKVNQGDLNKVNSQNNDVELEK